MKYIITVFAFLMVSIMTNAQDRLFAYTYQSNVLNKGDFDLEFWNTVKTGKVGDYSPYAYGQHLNQRIEFEAGLGKKVQTAFYLNSERFDFAQKGGDEMESEVEISMSNEWKWKLSDPVANAIGFALYGELEVGGHNLEWETKLIFDKRWQNDLLAFNLIHEYEIEKEVEVEDGETEVEWEHEQAFEINAGYLHFLNPSLAIGVELKNNNDITEDDGRINSVLFLGPSMHASFDKFFINLTVLPQLANLYKTDFAPGSKDLDNYEELEVRALIGYSFGGN